MPPVFGFNAKHLDGEMPLPLWQGRKTHFCCWSILVLCLQRKTSRLSHSYTDCKIWVPSVKIIFFLIMPRWVHRRKLKFFNRHRWMRTSAQSDVGPSCIQVLIGRGDWEASSEKEREVFIFSSHTHWHYLSVKFLTEINSDLWSQPLSPVLQWLILNVRLKSCIFRSGREMFMWANIQNEDETVSWAIKPKGWEGQVLSSVVFINFWWVEIKIINPI